MSLDKLSPEDVALIGRALEALAEGDIIEEFEFGTRIGVELADFREMIVRWPAWDDTNDESTECIAINNTLNDLLHGVGLSERRCFEMLGAGRAELSRVYETWAAARDWRATGVS